MVPAPALGDPGGMTTDTATPPTGSRRPRRLLLRLLAGTVALFLLLVLGLVGLVAVLYSRAEVSSAGRLGFANRLAIPPLLTPSLDRAGRKVFDLRLQAGTSRLLPGRPTTTWGANGAYLGPTLRASRGDRVTVHVSNGLPEATTIHWHGMHLPAQADGGPHQPIAPGTTWSPSWTVDQPAATLWYHPHPHGSTEDHAYRGVAGLFLLDDPEAGALPLPKRYGVDDIPVILQDKRFDRRGNLDFGRHPFSPVGRLGADVLVNGTHDPHVEVASQRVRFRLLNAATARVFEVGFADGRAFDLVATDGGLLDAPRRVARVPLSPGERAEIVAEFRPGERPVLRSFPPHLGAGFFGDRFAGGDDTLDLLQVRAAAALAPSPRVPDRLARHERLDPGAVVRTRRFDLDGGSAINARSMEMGRIDQAVTLGSTEVWEVHNQSGNPHSFHVHDVQFKVVGYSGGPRPPTLDGWKDTVFVPPGGKMRMLVRFSDYADPAVPYMFHCHLLRHEDNGMMGQFVVVAPGQAPAQPAHRH
jgi:FtsP/CotA-like multicopper oxidase with cupredoxin domain